MPINERLPDAKSSVRISNLLAQLTALTEGAGIGILPCFMAETCSGRTKVLSDIFAAKRVYWCVVHDDQANIARIRAAAEFVDAAIEKHRASFVY